MSRDSINVFLKVKKQDIYLICPFLESFEGMAAIRTPFPEEGEYAKLKLMVSPDFLDDFEKVLESLGKRLWLENLTPPSTSSGTPLHKVERGNTSRWAEDPLSMKWRGGLKG